MLPHHPFDPFGRRPEVTEKVKGSGDNAKIVSQLNALAKKAVPDPDPNIAEAIRPFLTSENEVIKKAADAAMRKWSARYAKKRAPDAEYAKSSPIKATILAHDEFTAYQQRVAGIFDEWRSAHSKRLRGLKVDDKPKQVIHKLSEDLLTRCADVPLLSRYDVYQRLMDYWADVMQDDVYLIAADGWLEAAKPRGVIDDKEKKKYKMDLIPPPLIVARYFADERAKIDTLQAKQDEATQALEEFVEEHAVEEGLLEEAMNDKGKVTKGGVKDRLKALKDEPESGEEEEALNCCLELMDAESDAKKAVKDAQERLDAAVLKKYGELGEAEIKTLAVDEKWVMSIQAAIEGDVQQIAQRLAGRVKDLEDRYVDTIQCLEAASDALNAKVEGHLRDMGLVWA